MRKALENSVRSKTESNFRDNHSLVTYRERLGHVFDIHFEHKHVTKTKLR